MKALHITQWDALYETSETRKIRALTFYAKPNKLVGIGINRTRQAERGLELLGVFGMMVDLASHGPPGQRGWFVRDGKALTPEEIAYLLMLPQEPVDAAIKHFSGQGINWLEWSEYSPGNGRGSREHRENTGRTPVEPPGNGRGSGKDREELPPISARGKTDREERLTKPERERNGEAQDREGQKLQFVSAQKRQQELEKLDADDLTPDLEAELKECRRLVKEIQKKQRRGDFSLVETAAPAPA